MRKAVQIAVTSETGESHGEIFVLAYDGTIWAAVAKGQADLIKWHQLPEIPQDEPHPRSRLSKAEPSVPFKFR